MRTPGAISWIKWTSPGRFEWDTTISAVIKLRFQTRPWRWCNLFAYWQRGHDILLPIGTGCVICRLFVVRIISKRKDEKKYTHHKLVCRGGAQSANNTEYWLEDKVFKQSISGKIPTLYVSLFEWFATYKTISMRLSGFTLNPLCEWASYNP